jgi:hypothetical protein
LRKLLLTKAKYENEDKSHYIHGSGIGTCSYFISCIHCSEKKEEGQGGGRGRKPERSRNENLAYDNDNLAYDNDNLAYDNLAYDNR